MNVVVLGGSGQMGGSVADRLVAAGHHVVRASRASGVDVVVPTTLVEAFRGADCVLDCLNVATLSKRRAVPFFETAARSVAEAARTAGVGHLVVMSIVNVTDPAVARSSGYYAGKAAQEAAYAQAGVPVSIVRTTAWFTLAETFLSQIRLGPVALVPRMRLRPVHPDTVADLVTAVVEAGPGEGHGEGHGPVVHELAGPEETDAPSMARRLAERRRAGIRVVALPVPVAGLRTGLLPGPAVARDTRRFDDWLAREQS